MGIRIHIFPQSNKCHPFFKKPFVQSIHEKCQFSILLIHMVNYKLGNCRISSHSITVIPRIIYAIHFFRMFIHKNTIRQYPHIISIQ